MLRPRPPFYLPLPSAALPFPAAGAHSHSFMWGNSSMDDPEQASWSPGGLPTGPGTGTRRRGPALFRRPAAGICRPWGAPVMGCQPWIASHRGWSVTIPDPLSLRGGAGARRAPPDPGPPPEAGGLPRGGPLPDVGAARRRGAHPHCAGHVGLAVSAALRRAEDVLCCAVLRAPRCVGRTPG